ncbi:hypothetical protein LZG75_08570 [Polynucleobacter sp. IMCC30063]|uniref:hypothetical protein n=1 Tax=unclassified Polynucleobacter TaxID=2640945 RepID=UPI001F369D4A|nr:MULTISPECIES: hypothetical protein [unclassified Polynucleobacter]MCE7506292.1 hypothetical protein [Polynucleobacter sp. IMCC30063]MCE7527572.1 hypothetical protein [Polynucleobacter sp. IMCC 30228]MCE7529390.1 hypothetical protein [Polynucleobacter sp. IMCC 29146]
MKFRILIWILWPAFLVAGLAEGLLFSFIRPEDLIFFGHHLTLSDEGIYSLGFFLIWGFCALSSALSIYILPSKDAHGSSEQDSGLI